MTARSHGERRRPPQSRHQIPAMGSPYPSTRPMLETPRWIASRAMTVTELASVDGAIAPTAETAIPLQDDGLYRGDGVFEVIRLYAGRPFALAEHLDRLERSAAAIELDAQRAALEPEIAALLEAHGDGDAPAAADRHPRRPADRADRAAARRRRDGTLATVTYAPTVILTGVKSLSYGANMQATRIAQGARRRRGAAGAPDGVVLEAPTSTIFWVAGGELRTPALDDRDPRLDHPRAVVDGARGRRGRVQARRPARRRRGLPRLDRPRDPAGVGGRRDAVRARAARPREAREAFEARGRRRAGERRPAS